MMLTKLAAFGSWGKENFKGVVLVFWIRIAISTGTLKKKTFTFPVGVQDLSEYTEICVPTILTSQDERNALDLPYTSL